jgi:hypothetical protein
VSFCPFRGKSFSVAPWISRQPSTNSNTLEQKGTKETKNTEAVITLVASIRGGQGDGYRLKPSRFLPFISFVSFWFVRLSLADLVS